MIYRFIHVTYDMAVDLVPGQFLLGHLVTEGTWMSKQKEAKQEDLGWLHTEQLQKVKQSSHSSQDLTPQCLKSWGPNPALPTFSRCDRGRLLNISLSFLRLRNGVNDLSHYGEK